MFISFTSMPKGFVAAALLMSALSFSPPETIAAPIIGIIGDSSTAVAQCAFFQSEGFACVNMPNAGPDQPLATFDVVIHRSNWTDPQGLLADYVRSGGGVITIGDIPLRLGIDSNATVRAWLGANAISGIGVDGLVAVNRHPVLGGIGPGNELVFELVLNCFGLVDTTGHPNAVPLARWNDGTGPIGIHYNAWQEGQSIYFTECFGPFGDDPVVNSIWINAINVLARVNPIPTTSTWSLIALTLLLAAAGTVLIRRRARVCVR